MKLNPATLPWHLIQTTTSDRAAGRFLRSDEGHGDATPAPVADAAAADPAPAVDDADAGATDGTVADGQADPAPESEAPAADPDATLLDKPADGEAKDGEDGEQSAEGDPAPYEGLQAPEGFASVDAEALAAATPLMRAFGVADEKAQDFLNQAAPVIQGMMERQLGAAAEAEAARRVEIETGWINEIKSDPDIGGANFARTTTLAAQAIDKFFPEAFRGFLRESRLGNHPDMVRGLAAIADATKDDDVDTTGGVAPAKKGHPLYDDAFLPPEQRG